MTQMKMNVDIVKSVADAVKTINDDMSNELTNLQKVVSKLGNSWVSPAATNAIDSFNEIVSTYGGVRYSAINNYVSFLKQNVIQGYNQTESVNVSLADGFK